MNESLSTTQVGVTQTVDIPTTTTKYLHWQYNPSDSEVVPLVVLFQIIYSCWGFNVVVEPDGREVGMTNLRFFFLSD